MPSAVDQREPQMDASQRLSALKRRRSTDTENEVAIDSKRQRTQNGDINTTLAAPSSIPEVDASPADTPNNTSTLNGSPKTTETTSNGADAASGAPHDRRRTRMPDEKQRSKRLFGALLNNLAPPAGGDRASQRRQEIEERRKAELRKEEEERVEDVARRSASTMAWRIMREEGVAREEMRIKHLALRDRANFLATESEPRLYYRPWELRADEEDRVERQITEAEAQIDRELKEYEIRRGRNLDQGNGHDGTEKAMEPRTSKADEKDDTELPDTNATATATDVDAADEATSKLSNNDDAAEEQTDLSAPLPAEVAESDLGIESSAKAAADSPAVDDKMEENILEGDGDEDTVIY